MSVTDKDTKKTLTRQLIYSLINQRKYTEAYYEFFNLDNEGIEDLSSLWLLVGKLAKLNTHCCLTEIVGRHSHVLYNLLTDDYIAAGYPDVMVKLCTENIRLMQDEVFKLRLIKLITYIIEGGYKVGTKDA